MENLAKKYLSGDEDVEIKLINRYYFSATLTILWSDLHVHVCIFSVWLCVYNSNYCCAFVLMFSFHSTFKFLYTMIKQNILHKIKLTHELSSLLINIEAAIWKSARSVEVHFKLILHQTPLMVHSALNFYCL